jgi:hypothetical protein
LNKKTKKPKQIIAAEAEESPKSKPFVLGNGKTQPPLPTTWEPADEILATK